METPPKDYRLQGRGSRIEIEAANSQTSKRILGGTVNTASPRLGRCGQPDFDPIHLLTSPSGTAFFLLTPFIVASLILRYPGVNVVTLRITSLVGFIIGWYNMLSNFGFRLETHWWNGALHLPLLLLSFYGLMLGYRRRPSSQGQLQ